MRIKKHINIRPEADYHLKESTSTSIINNYATGNAI